MVSDPRFTPRPGRAGDPHSAFSLAERDRRWEATRRAMDARGIDCLLVIGGGMNKNGNVRWLDNGDYGERSLVFPRKGNPMTFWLLQNWGKWYAECCWEGVRYRGHEGKVSIVAADAIRDMGYQGGTIGIVGLIGGGYGSEGAIPYMTYRNLKRLLPDASFCDASDILLKLRMVKSEEEIAMMDKASEMVNIEIDAVMRSARPGVRESEIYAELFDASLRAGSEAGRDNYVILSSGKGYPVNRRATDRILRGGDVLQIGYYARYGGYWSHPHTAMSLGPLDDEYKPLREAVLEAIEAAMGALKPGTPWSEVDRLSDEAVLGRGYYHEIPQVHGVGIDGIEPPMTTICAGNVPRTSPWREAFVEGSLAENDEWCELAGGRYEFLDDFTVEAGMVLAIEVKAVHEDRIFFEVGPQVVVEEAGPRVQTPDAMDVIEL
ncbi:MAG: M24 family metallopeptidase [Nitrospinota bacterium]